MKTIKYSAAVLAGIALLIALACCDNFFSELIPSDDNEISEFAVEGQISETVIDNDNNNINIPWNEGMDLTEQIFSRLTLPDRAKLLPVTPEYIQAAFPSIEDYDDLIKNIIEMPAEALTPFMLELIRQNRDFNVPALDKPVDSSRPVTVLVISGQGSVRRYTINMVIYVVFETNGGSDIGVQGVVYERPVLKPNDPFRQGYTFGGWYSDNNTFERPWNFDDVITEGVNLYARWTPVTYTVRYNKNAAEAEGVMEDSVLTYDVYEVLAANGFTLEDHIFAAWNTAPDGGGKSYGDRQTVSNLSAEEGAVVVLYAQWKYIDSNLITVIFNSNGGSPVSPVTDLKNGDRISKPADPARTGYTFGGWYIDNSTFAQAWDFSANTVTGNITLYAKWRPVTYTVRYDKNAPDAAGSTADSKHTYDSYEELTANGFVRGEEYVFSGWNTAPNGGGKGYGDGEAVSNLSAEEGAVVVLYAQWKHIDINLITVIFNSNGGSPVSPVTGLKNGDRINKPADPARIGYTFGGWYIDNSTFAQAWDFSANTVTENITLYAKWTPVTYTVRYDKNAPDAAGTVADSAHVFNEDKALTLNMYTRAGYTFTGWIIVSNGNVSTYTDGQTVRNLRTIPGFVTLYAQWKMDTYTVTYYPDGGTPVPDPNPATVNYGHVINQPPAMTNAGLALDKWYTDSDKTVPAVFPITVTENITLYAKWTIVTYMVRYDKNAPDAEGSMADSIHTFNEDKALTLNAYTRADYTFTGWTIVSNGNVTTYADGQYVRNLRTAPGIVTLYARWEPVRDTCTVTYYPDGGTPVPSPNPATVNKGYVIKQPPAMTKPGSTLDKWYTDSAKTVPAVFPIAVTENIALYAKWETVTYTVRYDKNAADAEGSMADSVHTYYVYKALTVNGYTRVGYKFTGWTIVSNGNVTTYTDGQFVRNLRTTPGTVILYARWEPVKDTYTVTYDPDGGTPVPDPNPATVKYGYVIKQPPAVTKTGSKFDKWYTDSAKTVPAVFPITVTENIALYAKWETVTYTVRYDKNAADAAGSMADSTHTFNEDKALTLNAYTRAGYTFTGWAVVSNGNVITYANGQSVRNLRTTPGTVTLYAQWKVILCTVTYDPDGGSPVPSPNPATVNQGAVINQPPAMARTGYTFDRWYTDSAKTVPAAFPITVTENVSLYAKWTPITYTVRYDRNAPDAVGTTLDSVHTYDVDKALNLNGYTRRVGFLFTGWAIVSNGNVATYTNGQTVRNLRTTPGTVTLYAQWKPQYVITYYPDGGTPVPANRTVDGGFVINQPPAMTRNGYTFHKWYRDADKKIPAVFPITVTENVNLYARWIRNIPGMVWMESGSFQMGKEMVATNAGDVTPVREVTLSDYYIGQYQVTQDQYETVMGDNPSYFLKGGGAKRDPVPGETQEKRPVETVSWYSALVFCNKLSLNDGLSPAYSISGSTNPDDWTSWTKGEVPTSDSSVWNAVEIVPGSNGYRLPTEAQWEYAAKGGDQSAAGWTPYIYSGSNNPDAVAWYELNSNDRTHEVGKKQPILLGLYDTKGNRLGLYDMSGNVGEWCWDWYGPYSGGAQTDPAGPSSGAYRVIRGGDYGDDISSIRSVSRAFSEPPSDRKIDTGFRLVRPAE